MAMVCSRVRLPKNAARFIMKMLNINHQQNNKLNGILKRGKLIQSGIHTFVRLDHFVMRARKAYTFVSDATAMNEMKRQPPTPL